MKIITSMFILFGSLLSVTNSVNEIETVTTVFNSVEDSFTYWNEKDENFGKVNSLLLKSGKTGEANTRKVYIKFDLKELENPTDVKNVTLNFQIYFSKKAIDFNVYQILDNSWKENEITWNNAPELNDVITSFNSPVLKGSKPENISVDVTEYIKARLKGGETTISFGIYDHDMENANIRISPKEGKRPEPRLIVETSK